MYGAGAGSSATAQAALAAEARAAAAAAPRDESDAGMVQDAVTGETRPAAAQGRVQRLDGGDEGDLWRDMQGMGISGGYQAQGMGPYYGSRGPASNPYYEQMMRSRGPLGAMRPGRNPAGGAAEPSGYGGASNAATLGGMGGGGGSGGGGPTGASGAGAGHPAMRGMGPMGMQGRMNQGQGGAGPGGSMAEQLLMQARMQQRMAMEAMGQGAMSEPRPQQGAGGNREWNHFFQGRNSSLGVAAPGRNEDGWIMVSPAGSPPDAPLPLPLQPIS